MLEGLNLARKFLSFLGTTDYKRCTYEYGDLEKEQCTTKFIQEALLKIFCKDWTEEDTAVIFLTEKAEKENWYNEEDEERRLKVILDELNIKAKAVPIPEGKTEDEIWEIFNIVINEIDDGDEVIFDITHSFRSLPMLALVILNYAKALKNIKLLGIYYGFFDPSASSNIMPIFDLTPLNLILEWSHAVDIFLKYGISGPFRDISVEQLKPHLRSEQWARDTRQFIESLNNLTMCIYTCRGKALSGKGTDRRSISAAVEAVNNNIRNIKDIDEDIQLKPLVPLMEKIEKRLEIFDRNDNLNIGIAAVKWAMENNLIQQAYTALDETIKTYVCEKYGYDSSNVDHREKIVNKALKIKAQDKREEEWEVEKEYWEQVKELVGKLDKELANLSENIGKFRNDINHFGFSKDATRYTKLQSSINDFFKEFLTYIDADRQ